MFDLSLAELGFIAVAAVIFIGPDELPVVIRHISKGLRGVKSLSKELRDAFEDLSKESGIHDISRQFENDIRKTTLIKGDDGNMYESYHPVHVSNAPKNPQTTNPAPPTAEPADPPPEAS